MLICDWCLWMHTVTMVQIWIMQTMMKESRLLIVWVWRWWIKVWWWWIPLGIVNDLVEQQVQVQGLMQVHQQKPIKQLKPHLQHEAAVTP